MTLSAPPKRALKAEDRATVSSEQALATTTTSESSSLPDPGTRASRQRSKRSARSWVQMMTEIFMPTCDNFVGRPRGSGRLLAALGDEPPRTGRTMLVGELGGIA